MSSPKNFPHYELLVALAVAATDMLHRAHQNHQGLLQHLGQTLQLIGQSFWEHQSKRGRPATVHQAPVQMAEIEKDIC